MHCFHAFHANKSLDCQCRLMMQKARFDKEVKAFGKKGNKMGPRRIPGVFRFNRSAVGIQKKRNRSAVGIQRKRVQLAECDLARGVSAVALKRVHLVQYFILFHFNFIFLDKRYRDSGSVDLQKSPCIWCSILFSMDEMSVELQAQT